MHLCLINLVKELSSMIDETVLFVQTLYNCRRNDGNFRTHRFLLTAPLFSYYRKKLFRSIGNYQKSRSDFISGKIGIFAEIVESSQISGKHRIFSKCSRVWVRCRFVQDLLGLRRYSSDTILIFRAHKGWL